MPSTTIEQQRSSDTQCDAQLSFQAAVQLRHTERSSTTPAGLQGCVIGLGLIISDLICVCDEQHGNMVVSQVSLVTLCRWLCGGCLDVCGQLAGICRLLHNNVCCWHLSLLLARGRCLVAVGLSCLAPLMRRWGRRLCTSCPRVPSTYYALDVTH